MDLFAVEVSARRGEEERAGARIASLIIDRRACTALACCPPSSHHHRHHHHHYTLADSFHADQIKACAKAGKHVFCEKPIATDLPETIEAINACKLANVKLMTALQRRFDPNFARVREAIKKVRREAARAWLLDATF